MSSAGWIARQCRRAGSTHEELSSFVFFEAWRRALARAAPNRFMTRLAMQQVDDQGSAASSGDHVTDDDYGAAPKVDEAYASVLPSSQDPPP
jgi:hypothetical protein